MSTPRVGVRSPRSIVAGIVVMLAVAGEAPAKPPIRDAWVGHYSSSQSDDNVVAGTGDNCQLCHQSVGGGDGWNAYGWAVRQRLGAGDTNLQAFANVEGQNSDGDTGGSTNLAEITASAQPGWTPGAVNTIFFKSGTTLAGQSPPAIAGNLDPAGGTTSTTSSSTSTTTTTSTSTTTSSSTSSTTSSTSTSTSTSSSVSTTTSSSSTSSSTTTSTSSSSTTSTSTPGATSTTSTSSTTSSSTSSSTTSSTSSTSTSSSSTTTTSTSTSSSSSTTTTSTSTSSSTSASSSSSTSTSSSSTSSSSTSSTTSTTLPGTVTLTLPAVRDGTLYSESDDTANGAGQHLFAGETNEGTLRRALLGFDVSAIPPGSTVTSAALTLFVSRTRTQDETVTVHRALADWGEGASDASAEEGTGAPATPGDATWGYRFYETVAWTVPGGDFDPVPSASAVVGAANAFYTWAGSVLADDVQAWIDGTEANQGWIVIGNEADLKVAKRFDSRENPVVSQRPRLTVQFLSSGSTTTTLVSTTTTTTVPGVVLEKFVDPLPRPAVAQPESGVAGGAASYRLRIREVEQQLHRDLPPTRVWGFGDGSSGATYPGPTIETRRDAPISVTWVNDLRDAATGELRTAHYLPVDTCPHGAEDASPRTVVHLHGGHVPAAFDGYPEATILPGEETTYTYPNAQPPSTLWYHDHALGITRLNVYMGLAGFYLLRDADEAALGLPAGEFEVPLAIQDRRFKPDGALDYPAAWEEHFFGDTVLVNGKVWPYFEVKPGKYRFRIVSGSTSRTYRLALSTGAPFAVIGTESGLLPAPVPVTSITLGSGERADVVLDFAAYAPGTTLRLVNDAPAPFPGTPGVGVIPDVLEFRVVAGAAHTAPLPASLRPLEHLDEGTAATARAFELRKASDPCTGQVWLINGLGWDDITERPQLGTTEVWSFVNRSGIMHPMHLHLVFFQVLDRQAFEVQGGIVVPVGPRVPPPPEEAGWKDTVRVGPNEIVRLITRFEDYKGKYPYHCHILEHEDHEMMRQFETVLCGDGELDAGEGCDDGNRDDGDGCSSACASEGTTTSTTLGATTTTVAMSTSTVTTTSSLTVTSTVTSTTVVGSTTTTTLLVEERLLSGATLRLTDRPGKPRKRRLRIVSKDRDLLDAPEPPADEATLRVLAVGGDAFAAEYSLPATGWQAIAPKNPSKGLRYRDEDGPIQKIVVKTGTQLSIRGRGDGLVQSLGVEPDRVQVELRLGARRYCLEFGGESRFRAERTLERRGASRPVACP